MTQAILPSRKRLNKLNCYKPINNIHDNYRFYTKKYGTATTGGTQKKIFRAVINEFNKWMSDQLIKGDKFDLPFGLGTLEVVSEKQRYKVEEGKLNTKLFQIDWPTTYAYWEKHLEALKEKKLFYYINDHSDGNRYKFYWGKFGVKKRQIRYYSFHPSRLLSRRLAAHILDPDTIKNYSERC